MAATSDQHRALTIGAAALALALGGACSRTPAPGLDAGAPAGPDAAEEAEALHFPARRCAECHGRQRVEWAQSSHSRSASRAFLASLAHVEKPEQAACMGCHVPLAGAGERIAGEGVACDACHTAVKAAPGPGALVLAPERATRFGPYKDGKDHYFHKVAFSEFVTTSALCTACHEDRVKGPVPIFTSVAEWRQGPHSDVDCQTCHMPGLRAVAAKGGPERPVSRHDFSPDRGAALSRALDLVVRPVRKDHSITVHLSNSVAGHSLPTDLPERRLRLVVEGWDGGAQSFFREERVYGRVLVDAAGAPAPFFRAVREASDTRLSAGETREERFRLGRAGKVTVQLWLDPHDKVFDPYFGPAAPLLLAERSQEL